MKNESSIEPRDEETPERGVKKYAALLSHRYGKWLDSDVAPWES